MKRIWLVVVWIFFTNGVLLAQNVQTEMLVHGNIERTFHIQFPAGYSADEPTPTVIFLHGGGTSGQTMIQGWDLDALADTSGYIVVYPDALDGRWQFDLEAERTASEDWQFDDDISFLTALIESMVQEWNSDPEQIYLLGQSNGGIMALTMRCVLSEQFAGVTIVAATLNLQQAERCVEAEPVPMMILLGTRDTIFPWSGTAGVSAEGELEVLLSVAQMIPYLTDINECSDDSEFADAALPISPFRVISEKYNDCEGAIFWFYALIDAEHTWQDPALQLQAGSVGGMREAIWEFMQMVQQSG